MARRPCAVRCQNQSSTMPITIRPAESPIHNPTAPSDSRKHKNAPSGKPKIQYPAKWHSIGVRVSPAPRRAPVAVTCKPSKS